jgi:hypothetical protein
LNIVESSGIAVSLVYVVHPEYNENKERYYEVKCDYQYESKDKIKSSSVKVSIVHLPQSWEYCRIKPGSPRL